MQQAAGDRRQAGARRTGLGNFGTKIPPAACRLPHFLLPLAGSLALIGWVQHDPFFWDTVQLASKHAHHFYENGLQWTALPPAIDSGHPPVFGFYLAVMWTVFGKTLPVGHWAMLPFVMGIAVLLVRLGERLGAGKWAVCLPLLALSDPVLAGQMTLVGPDAVLACFFLLAVEAIQGKKPWLLTVAILGLCAISMRGMMTAGALLVWQIGMQVMEGSGTASGIRKFRIPYAAFRILSSFLPGFAFAAWFLWWHRQATGWTGYHPGSSWAPAFEPARGWELLKNVAVLGWRWLDFGRVFEWVALFLLLWNFWRRKYKFSFSSPAAIPAGVAFLWVCGWVFLSPSAVLYHNLSAHRYFLPAFLTMHLLVFQWIAWTDWADRTKRRLFVLLIAGMATGNLWVYPRGISTDWDSTLAHRPYHRLRADALAFLEQRKVDFTTVGSAFPNLNTGENLLLNGDQRRFAELDWQHNTYIFASNIFNDLSATDYDRLHRDWNLIYRQTGTGVWVEIYGRR